MRDIFGVLSLNGCFQLHRRDIFCVRVIEYFLAWLLNKTCSAIYHKSVLAHCDYKSPEWMPKRKTACLHNFYLPGQGKRNLLTGLYILAQLWLYILDEGSSEIILSILVSQYLPSPMKSFANITTTRAQISIYSYIKSMNQTMLIFMCKTRVCIEPQCPCAWNNLSIHVLRRSKTMSVLMFLPKECMK